MDPSDYNLEERNTKEEAFQHPDLHNVVEQVAEEASG